jgi:serine/threonine-protein kinase
MARTFEPGKVVAGKYRIDRPLGKGAMGAVFGASTLANGQPVAIKILLSDAIHPAERARFVQEGLIAFRLKSRHCVKVFEVAALEDGMPYIVMEMLQGEDLAHLIEREGPQSPERAIHWILEACEALAEAHPKGVVHRDLKPANLFLAKQADGSTIIKILDFGLSKLVDDTPGSQRLTQTLSVFGSPAYMAPEQLRDTGAVDARADLYSLGVTLFELLTCTLPIIARSPAELAALVMRDPPKPIRALRPEIPLGLEAAIMTCLEKNPRDRWQSAKDLTEALTSALVDPKEAPKTIMMSHSPAFTKSDASELAPTRMMNRKKKKNPKTIAAVFLLVLLVGIVGVAVGLILKFRPH